MIKEKKLTSQNVKEEIMNAAPVAASVEQTKAVETVSEEADIVKELEGMINGGEAADGLDYTLDCEKSAVKQVYDNAGAYATLLSIMNRYSQLDVQFKLDKENCHYAWVEAKGVAPFKYYLKNQSFNGIIRYLRKGEITDFDSAPMEYEKAKFTDEFTIMKLFVDKGIMLQCTPLFRERPEYISAFLPCKKGKITFRVKRTDCVLEYLREAGQYI